MFEDPVATEEVVEMDKHARKMVEQTRLILSKFDDGSIPLPLAALLMVKIHLEFKNATMQVFGK